MSRDGPIDRGVESGTEHLLHTRSACISPEAPGRHQSLEGGRGPIVLHPAPASSRRGRRGRIATSPDQIELFGGEAGEDDLQQLCLRLGSDHTGLHRVEAIAGIVPTSGQPIPNLSLELHIAQPGQRPQRTSAQVRHRGEFYPDCPMAPGGAVFGAVPIERTLARPSCRILTSTEDTREA